MFLWKGHLNYWLWIHDLTKNSYLCLSFLGALESGNVAGRPCWYSVLCHPWARCCYLARFYGCSAPRCHLCLLFLSSLPIVTAAVVCCLLSQMFFYVEDGNRSKKRLWWFQRVNEEQWKARLGVFCYCSHHCSVSPGWLLVSHPLWNLTSWLGLFSFTLCTTVSNSTDELQF